MFRSNKSCSSNAAMWNKTSAVLASDLVAEERQYALLLLLLFPVSSVFGNCLVVLSVWRERSLRTTTNLYIVSLAIADISLAVSVMPLCTWLEVNQGFWEFSSIFCDIFIMLDVLFCTASILNLAAISVDRYIAVSRPLLYSHHNKWHRVHVSIGLTWIVSFFIALPVVCGFNHTDAADSHSCTFLNPDFIILSSAFSFLLPSVVVLILYHRIFLAIRARARSKVFRRRHNLKSTTSPTTAAAGSTATASPLECQLSKVIENPLAAATTTFLRPPQPHGASSTTTSTVELHYPLSASPTRQPRSSSSEDDYEDEDTPMATGPASPHSPAPNLRSTLLYNTLQTANLIRGTLALRLPLLNSGKQNPEKMLVKREKKATKTLVIVLVIFLLCWVPFFFLNVGHAVCLKTLGSEASSYHAATQFCALTQSKVINIAVWLGYINSCLNPLIYTVFNVEFRRAFKKILNLS